MYIVVATKATTNNIACSTVIVKINNEDDATDVNYNNEFKVSFLEKIRQQNNCPRRQQNLRNYILQYFFIQFMYSMYINLDISEGFVNGVGLGLVLPTHICFH